MIAVILLIGIVKKNAIMMVDFAIEASRHGATTSREAIEQACLLRFRPIMMTTAAALLGALPLAFGTGEGLGDARAARHRDRRRADREPDAHALYDAGGLSLYGPLPRAGGGSVGRARAAEHGRPASPSKRRNRRQQNPQKSLNVEVHFNLDRGA